MEEQVLGIALWALKEFVAAHSPQLQGGKAAAQVIEEIIKPATADSRDSYAERVFQSRSSQEPNGQAGVGRATVFVSHVHSAPFLETAAAVIHELSRDADKEHFLWFDLFVLPQHAPGQRDPEWLRTTLRAAIASAQRVVAVIHRWSAPVNVSRSWCLLELHFAIEADVPVVFVVEPSKAAADMGASLTANALAAASTAAGRVDARGAAATAPEDKRAIDAVLAESSGGFEAVEAAVGDRLKLWLALAGAASARAALEQKQQQHTAAVDAEERRAVQLAGFAGALLLDLGHWAPACSALEAAAAASDARGGAGGAAALRVKSRLGQALRRLGRWEEAAAVLAGAAAASAEAHGDAAPPTLRLRTARAQALREAGRHEEAESTLRGVLKEQKGLLATVVASLSRGGAAPQQQPAAGGPRCCAASAAASAAEQPQAASTSSGSTEALPQPADVLETLFALGLVELDRGRAPQAEATLKLAAAGAQSALGKSQPQLLVGYLKGYASALQKLGKRAEALRVYAAVLPAALVAPGGGLESAEVLSALSGFAALYAEDPQSAAAALVNVTPPAVAGAAAEATTDIRAPGQLSRLLEAAVRSVERRVALGGFSQEFLGEIRGVRERIRDVFG